MVENKAEPKDLTVTINVIWRRGEDDAGQWYWTLRHGRNRLVGAFPGEKRMLDGSVNVNVFHEVEKALTAELGASGPLVLSHHKVVVEVTRPYEFNGTRP